MDDKPDAGDSLRDRVLDAVLFNVAFDGWGPSGVRAAVRDGAITAEEAALAFPGGALDMIEYHSIRADRRMVEELERRNVGGLKVRDRITLAVRVRLEQNAAHREGVRRALAILALPINAPLAARLLYRTVDAIWYAAGDRSADFSFYTKRATLAAVYSSTVLYWLNDRSEGMSDTWAFLDRRIADVMRFEQLKSRIRGFGDRWRPGSAR
ncbi:COQ9 family protein [Vineibacter terrae]|uniref:COQ9 family protein n=1 Tax=Vineibacter terrae TaxID=2586908 RepID=A0A5C8PBU9_9HYPH|nr:COQ9 family protein [Vineibacter terrae]TXL71055.1 COQ9 family protein [Vineibacter terrae]